VVDEDFRGAIYWVLHNLLNIAQERKHSGLRGGVLNDTSTGFGAVGEVVSLRQRLVSRRFRLGKQLAAGHGVWRQRMRAGRGGAGGQVEWDGRQGPHGYNRSGS